MPRKGHTEEQIIRALRESRRRQESGRYLPRTGCVAAGVLQLEAAVCGAGIERAARVAAASGGEPEAEDVGRRFDARPAYPSGSAVKKGLKPAARRQFVSDVREV